MLDAVVEHLESERATRLQCELRTVSVREDAR